MDVAPGTIVVYADLGCPWAHLCVYRLHDARKRHGLEGRLAFDMRTFPLELINEQPTPKEILDAEVPVVATRDTNAGWSQWDQALSRWAVTMLPGAEAVYAVKEQGMSVSDRLDRALRVAFFRDSRCISMHHEIMAVARRVDGLDAGTLEEALISGRHRADVFRDLEVSKTDEVRGSPHVFLPEGDDHHNPGIEMSVTEGFPQIHSDDPAVYDDIVKQAV